MLDIPLWYLITFMFVLGSIMGSFLDVVALRFHTGKSINGRSHCLSCGHILSWYELFPLFSYVVLRGRCRQCQARIPARLFLMEVITGLLFVLVALSAETLLEAVVGILFIMVALVITLYDVRHLVIPDVLVWAMAAVAIISMLIDVWPLESIAAILPYAISSVFAASFYLCLWFISKGRWIGLGDAKLALPLGFMLSAYETFSFVVLSFWVGAGVSLFLLALQWLRKRGQTYLRFLDIPLTMKSEVPFAPFLLVAFGLVYFLHIDVLRFFTVNI